MKKLILVCAILLLSASGHTECPSADLTGDCKVGLADLAVMASQWESEPNMAVFSVMASQWMTEGIREIVFIDIPGGSFQMGDSFGEGSSDELPVHTVTLSPFRMSMYKVTNAQYAEYLNAADTEGLIRVSEGVVYAASEGSDEQPYFTTSPAPVGDPDHGEYSQIEYAEGTFVVHSKSGRDMSNHPVVQVSWYGAKGFCDYYGYRLPTEAEWEYAARGGEHNPYYRFPWGDTISHSQANYQSNSSHSYDVSPTLGYHPSYDDLYPYTSPVGTFAANGYGLHGMSGNVWEWCNDWYSTSYIDSPGNDPTGPAGGLSRVLRGGSWLNTAYYCRVACRHPHKPSSSVFPLGFRLVLDL